MGFAFADVAYSPVFSPCAAFRSFRSPPPLPPPRADARKPLKLTKDDSPTVLSHQLITAPNPGEKGTFAVKTMYYGSGTDKRRAEFRDSVTIKTKTVDASPFVSMEPDVAKAREKDWGFGDEQVADQRARVVSRWATGPFRSC